MSSLRRLNRRLLRWHRYAHKTYWNPRVTRPRWQLRPTEAPGHKRAWDAREHERERRQCHRSAWPDDACFDCGLSDSYNGHGDGIGSCECARCDRCGSGPGCDCRDDDGWCEGTDGICDDPDCCGEPDDDAGHSDSWPPMITINTGGLT